MPARRRRRIVTVLITITCAMAASGVTVSAQDLEPRAYAASPIGTTFLVAGIARSAGGVLVDPSLPLEDVQARLGVASVGVGQTFDLATRTALLVVAVPYGRAHASGRVGETSGSATRSGLADLRAKLSVNLLGGRALRAREFAATPERGTIVGASLSVVAPSGSYRSEYLVNLGSNRWAFKPEAGVSVRRGRWTLDGYAGIWLFTTNDSYYPGMRHRSQDPVTALQGHASYTIRPRLWMAFDGTWYSGGTTSVDGVDNDNRQSNSRLGATLAVPLGQRQSLKGSFSTGATTRIGGDFNTVGVAWQMIWVRP